jgi:hypothetical protein
MYIAHVGDNYYIKRMPNSGVEHAAGCVSYETPAELSGRGEVDGSAIQQGDDGNVTLKFQFSLSKKGDAVEKAAKSEATSATTSGTKLTLRGALHYLWEEAGLSRWVPDLTVVRDWSWVEQQLMVAAESKETKRTPLVSLLYVPETFVEAQKQQIYQRRMARIEPILGAGNSGKKLMMFVAEVDSIDPGRFGYLLTCKQLPDLKFNVDPTLHKQFEKLFGRLMGLWNYVQNSHLIAIGTFSVDSHGVPEVNELSVMLTTPDWVPIENNYDLQLVQLLTEKQRSFVKVLRYNLPAEKPILCALLTDVRPGPVGMYLFLDDLIAHGPSRDGLVQIMKDSSLPSSWLWEPKTGVPPTLPSSSGLAILEAQPEPRPQVLEFKSEKPASVLDDPAYSLEQAPGKLVPFEESPASPKLHILSPPKT